MALLAFLDHSLMTAFTFAETLACWQRRAGRSDLPWQQYHTPYERWLSEVMLQQTQVETVIPYFERFLAAFPSVEALAAASEAQVMKLWAGLGYYSRGRNLHRAAQMVVKEMQGRFPTTADELIKLPGIGPSTAAAVAAFTSGEAKEPMIDGNVKRVLARIDGIPGRVGEKAFETALAAQQHDANSLDRNALQPIRRDSWIWEVWFAAENLPIVRLVPCAIFAKHSRWGVQKTIRGRKQQPLKKNAGWFWSSLRRPQGFGSPPCADEFGRGSMHRSWLNAARKRGTRQ